MGIPHQAYAVYLERLPTHHVNSLPFINDNDCGLGIAVRSYLDDLPTADDPTSPETRAEAKIKGSEWFQHTLDYPGNLDKAFRLWDAVSLTIR